MMTSKGSDTKIFSKRELEQRQKIMLRPDNYTTTEKEDAQVENEVRGRKFDDDTYTFRTSPIDPRDVPRKLDIRKKKEVGN